MATPLQPINLNPWGGQMISASSYPAFTWSTDATQTAYYIEYCLTSSGATVYNTDWQVYSTAQHTFSAGTFTVNLEYKWRVKIRNSSGIESVFSEWAVFKIGYMTLLAITNPASDMVALSSLPTYQFLFTPPMPHSQQKFRVQTYSAALWDTIDALTAAQQEACTWDQLELYGSALDWDSGDILGLGSSIVQPPGYLPSGVYWYKTKVTVTDDAATAYISDLRTFYILLNAIPPTPIITATADSTNGQNIVTITNPAPSGGQVSASYNRLYRRKPDNSWLLIQDNITAYGYDKTCKSAIQEEYAVTAVGTNGIESGYSVSAYATCTLTSYWFTDTVSNLTVHLSIDPQWGKMTSQRGRKEYWGEDEIYPTILYDPSRYYQGSFKAALLYSDAASSWPTYLATIWAVLDATTKSPIIMRTPFGDRYEVDVSNFQVDPSEIRDNYRYVSFDLEETVELVPPSTYVYSAQPEANITCWLVNPVTLLGMSIGAGSKWGAWKSERDRYSAVGLSQLMPSVNYGNKKVYRGSFSGYLVAPEDGSIALADLLKQFRELVDNKTKSPLMLATRSGDRFLVDTYNFNFSIFDRFNNARQVSFEFVEVGSAASSFNSIEYFIMPGMVVGA